MIARVPIVRRVLLLAITLAGCSAGSSTSSSAPAPPSPSVPASERKAPAPAQSSTVTPEETAAAEPPRPQAAVLIADMWGPCCPDEPCCHQVAAGSLSASVRGDGAVATNVVGALERGAAGFKSCRAKLQVGPGAGSASAAVTLQLDEDGRVTAASADGVLQSPEATACVLAALRGLELEAGAASSVVLDVKLNAGN